MCLQRYGLWAVCWMSNLEDSIPSRIHPYAHESANPCLTQHEKYTPIAHHTSCDCKWMGRSKSDLSMKCISSCLQCEQLKSWSDVASIPRLSVSFFFCVSRLRIQLFRYSSVVALTTIAFTASLLRFRPHYTLSFCSSSQSMAATRSRSRHEVYRRPSFLTDARCRNQVPSRRGSTASERLDVIKWCKTVCPQSFW